MPQTGKYVAGINRLQRRVGEPPTGGAPVARKRVWCAVALGWVCAAPIHAGELNVGVGLSIEHDNNVARVEENSESELTRVLVGGLFYRESTVDLTARVLAQLEDRHYYRQTHADQTGGSLDGAAVWTILPRQFAWIVEDVFREVQVDITAPDTPANRTKSNAFSTGPDLTVFGGAANSGVLGGRYGQFDIENSNADNRRYAVYARGLHTLSKRTVLSLNYEAVRVDSEPGAQVLPRVLRRDWFGRIENRSTTNSAALDFGSTRVTQYGGPAQDPSRLARLTLSQVLTSQSRFRFSVSDQISDTYSDLIKGAAGSTAPAEEGVVAPPGTELSADFYRSRRGDFGYVNNDRQFRYTLQAYGRRVDFETSAPDYNERAGRLIWTWSPGAIRLNAFAEYTRRKFENLDQDTYRTYAVSVTYRVSSNVSVSIEGTQAERESTVPSNSFVDRRVAFLVGYSSGQLYEPAPRR